MLTNRVGDEDCQLSLQTTYSNSNHHNNSDLLQLCRSQNSIAISVLNPMRSIVYVRAWFFTAKLVTTRRRYSLGDSTDFGSSPTINLA
jgi:hypothetical protein